MAGWRQGWRLFGDAEPAMDLLHRVSRLRPAGAKPRTVPPSQKCVSPPCPTPALLPFKRRPVYHTETVVAGGHVRSAATRTRHQSADAAHRSTSSARTTPASAR
ncbi:hypothetical protein GN956_G2662 [Arapaima gigas]